MVRTRIAPSPTGLAHIGTIYQALFDKAFALKHSGAFVLRIEDTDQNRFVEGAQKYLLAALEWVGLTPDEGPGIGGEYGPYVQSKRLELYRKYAEELVSKGHAYYCFCSVERLKEIREKKQKDGKIPMYDKYCRNLSKENISTKVHKGVSYVIRMKIPEHKKIVCKDLVRGDIEFDSNVIDDQVILKSDGYPTYHLAVVVDDHLMKISHVVRGPEWITSFPKHQLLYDFFGWDMPVFAHTPMITNMDGSKLSKRHGHASVDWYRKSGFLPEAVLNFVSLLGWSHPDEKEIFSFDEFVKVFDLKDLSTVSPKFDLQKLEWMNGQYIQNLSKEEFMDKLQGWLSYCKKEKHSAFLSFIEDLEDGKKLLFADINKPRIKKWEDILALDKFFVEDVTPSKTLLTKQKDGVELRSHLEWVLDLLDKSEWDLKSLKNIEKKIVNQASELNWKVAEVFYPIRIAICGSKISPPLFESIYILGKKKAMSRIKRAISFL